MEGHSIKDMANPRELAEQAFALLEDALRQSEARTEELREELERHRAPGSVDEQIDTLSRRLEESEQERTRLERELGRQEELLAEERAKAEQLKAKLEVAESGPDKLTKKEINYWRSKIDDFDRASREQKNRLAESRRELEARTAELEELAENTRNAEEAAAAATRRADELAAQNTALEGQLAEAEQLLASRTAELDAAKEQIAGLEQELRDEKECTDNLSEVANERRGLITQLEDRLAEAEERYEEARWRLGKAQHFERLVKRRKQLIKALIERIRQRNKANVALKAGLDGLRRFKAAAEARQHELLARLDKLKAKIKEQEETIARHHGATITEAELKASHQRVAELERRIEDQVEIIQTLEEELKTAKALQQVRTESGSEIERLRGEVERLRREIDTKNELVARLESDADLQQRKLAQLRSNETETQRLKSKVEEQEATIASLSEAVDGWRRKYEFMAADTPTEYKSAAEK